MQREKLTDKVRNEYARIAYYYHKAGLTQDEIAKKLHMSRQRVNRILGECVSLGIVQINIVGYDNAYLELETALEKRYGLAAVRVVECGQEESAYDELGAAAGRYLAEVLRDGDIIGFSRGRAMSALVDNMPQADRSGLMVTQLMGGWNGQQAGVNVDDIVHRFSKKFDTAASMLYAPVMVKNLKLRESIMREPFFQEAYQVLKSCTVAVVGIGDVGNGTLFPGSELTAEEEDAGECLRRNAAGEICTHFFDINGAEVDCALNERIIAISREDFLRIPRRIGVGGLPSKHRAILGAVRGGYVNALITDAGTAHTLLK